ncbi:DUF3954 domain-containing protein [Desulfuribacillus alkaliarsenatis]
MDDAVYIVKDCTIIRLDNPSTGYGQQTIFWQAD